MGVSHHRFHLETFFLCKCARPYLRNLAFSDILDRVEDGVWCRQPLRKLKFVWKPQILCHDRLETCRTIFPKNTVFDTHATQMTEAQSQPDNSHPSIHSLRKIGFWLNIVVRSQRPPLYLSWSIFLHLWSRYWCMIHCHLVCWFRRIETLQICISITLQWNPPAAQKWMINVSNWGVISW